MHCRTGNSARIRAFGESQTEIEDRPGGDARGFPAKRYAPGRAVGDGRPGARIAANARCAGLRGDAGEDASERLPSGLKPAEEIGRWGDDEFLVLSHERNAAMLAAHAQTPGGLGAHDRFSLVGRPCLAHREYRRGAG